MKKKIALLAVPVALAFTLSGCNYVDAGIQQIQKDSAESKIGPNLDTGKEVKTEDGSYLKVRASDDFNNAIENSVVLLEDGEDSEIGSSYFTRAVSEYFFSHFIDSTALEGGEKTMKAFKAAALKQKALSNTKHTKDWLATKNSQPVLTTTFLGIKNLKPFIHDGDPRLTDATLNFDEKKFVAVETPDGYVTRVPAKWTADYRITDETLLNMLVDQNPAENEEDIRAGLTDEAKDGRGENRLHVDGTLEVDVLMTEDGPKIYGVGVNAKYSHDDAVKPEYLEKNKPENKK